MNLGILVVILFSFLLVGRVYGEENCTKISKIDIDLVRLTDKLFCNYDDDIAPKNPTISIQSILFTYIESDGDYVFYSSDIDFVELQSILILKWTDERLIWDKSKYNNINEVNMESDFIWLPEFRYLNRHYSGSPELTPMSHARVKSNGEVTCRYPHSMRITCKGDLSNWPYDTQSCWFFYVSEYDVDIMNKESLFDIVNRYTPNNEWEVDSIVFEKKEWGQFSHDTELKVYKYHFLLKLNRLSEAFATGIVTKPLTLMIMTLVSMGLEIVSTERKLLSLFNVLAHLLCNEKVYYFYGEWGINTWTSWDGTKPITRNIYKFYNISQFISIYVLLSVWMIRYIMKIGSWEFPFLRVLNTPSIFQTFFIQGPSFEVFCEDKNKKVQKVAKKIKYKEWYLVGRLIERLSILVVVAIYTFAFVKYIPWQFII